MHKGKYGEGLTRQLFSEAVHRDMWTPQTIQQVSSTPPYNQHFAAYGLGWGLTDVKGYKQVSHTGGLVGMVTQMILLPELQLGIIVLTNQQSSSAFNAISTTIKDSYLGIPATDRVKQFSEISKTRQAEADKITEQVWNTIAAARNNISAKPDLSVFEGIYKDDWFGEIVISEKNGNLRWQSRRSPRMKGTIELYKGSTLIVKWDDRSFDADAFITFQLDANGKAENFKMKG